MARQAGHMLTLAVVALLVVSEAAAQTDVAFIFFLGPGKQECFYQEVAQDSLLEMEFQVLMGGKLDVDYFVYDPSGKMVEKGSRLPDGLYEVEKAAKGEWRFCFSNRFSIVQGKQVFFSISVDGEHMFGDDDDVDEALEKVVTSVNKIHENLRQVSRHQANLKSRENRHRQTMEFNNYQVNLFSALEIAAIVFSGVLQVLAIRRLFREKSRR